MTEETQLTKIKKEIPQILLALNSSQPVVDKYPFGNRELFEKVKLLETCGLIAYDKINQKWVKL